MERYICIHGHFYQPPRENPWLEDVEFQDTAYPYHDWNERITAECYEPNTASRILDAQQRIGQITNNYAGISFNFGPTLLAWLEKRAPHVYQAILTADRESQTHFGGHGSALAQAYNHLIMPLAASRDKETQVIWGIRDFRYRFGRDPEGMWLSETAVDLESLEILAANGIAFTILAPHQAGYMRQLGAREWIDVRGARIDPTRPYQLRLPSGRSIAIFFYDGPVSRAVAFERLLTDGVGFANRITGTFHAHRTWPQIAHIATDGETYGHHHRHGDMALAYALRYIETAGIARLTNYAAYLATHPPTWEVQIIENTSWSCIHGVERWRSDCGCNSGGNPGWGQAWRTPLRAALDWLRDTIATRFEEQGVQLLRDPWAARNDYIELLLDRTPDTVEAFIAHHTTRRLDEEEKTTLLKLMELQRHAMLMYTSCGWFFDDLSNIETIQVIMYAGRALQLAQEVFEEEFETEFLNRLELAKGNAPDAPDGRQVYLRNVQPAVVDLPKVVAHYAMSSLFENYNESDQVYCYTVERKDYRLIPAGKARLLLGRAQVTSNITGDSALVSFAVIHLGDHNLSCGVRKSLGIEAYQLLVQEISDTFMRADTPGVIRMVDKHFGLETYSLKLLFRDEQRRILGMILDSSLAEAEAAYRQIYEHYAPLMRFLSNLGTPVPRGFQMAAEFALNTELRRLLEAVPLDLKRIPGLIDEAARVGVPLDKAGLGYTLERTIGQLTEQLAERPTRTPLIESLEAAVSLARTLPFEVDYWKTQNVYYDLLRTTFPDLRERARKGNKSARAWLVHFQNLGMRLGFQSLEGHEGRTA